jgi:hypothetical protein
MRYKVRPLDSFMRKTQIYQRLILVLLLLTVGPLPARGGIVEDIQEHETTPSVIVPEGKGYIVKTFSRDELAARMELLDPSKLENARFRVVRGEGDETAPVTDFDGRNVLFHLTEAANYFQKLADRTGVHPEGLKTRIVVRVGMVHAANPIKKFSKVPESNDSGYMPFNDGEETWFFHREKELRDFSLYDLLTTQGLALLTKSYAEMGLDALVELDRSYDGGIDTAKQPTVIWHEAFHWADEPVIPVVWQPFATGEDFANYFAASQYGKPYVADLNEFSSRSNRRDYSKIRALKDFRASAYNSRGFVPSLLWQIRVLLGQERADAVIWSSLPLLRQSVSEADSRTALEDGVSTSPLLTTDEKAQALALLRKHGENFDILDQIFGNRPLDPIVEPPVQTGDPGEEEIAAVAARQAQELGALTSELRGMGVALTVDEETALEHEVDGLLEVAPPHPGFGSKAVSVLKTIAKPFAKVGTPVARGLGFAGEAVQAAGSFPLIFGTDFFTKLFLGQARFTDATPGSKPTTAQDLVGAAGGSFAFYFANHGINAIGHAYNGPVAESAMGIVLADELACSRRSAQIILPGEAEHATPLQKYCRRIARMTNAIRTAAARSGAAVGGALR